MEQTDDTQVNAVQAPCPNGNDEAKNINEEHKVWRKNTPFLYDGLLTRNMEWPSLTLQWMPHSSSAFTPPDGQEPVMLEDGQTVHTLLLGTNTSGQDKDYIILAEVMIPEWTALEKVDQETPSRPLGKLRIRQKICHEGEVNRARYMPNNSNIIATHGPDSSVYVFDISKHPLSSSVPNPQMTLQGDDLSQAAKKQVDFFLLKTLADLRINEMFAIIAGYDETKPALQDLKTCLETTYQRDQLIASLQKVIEIRLLHPGANTADIITLYVSAIKVLRLLDPSQVILHSVCDRIQWYLREREDTVRCVVKSLTEEEGQSELIGEVGAGPLIEDDGASDDEPDGGENPAEWTPAPVEAIAHGGRWRTADIISSLVGIYGSKELFVSEYRMLLADRLLSALDNEIDKEMRTVELLKLRFGDASLHYSEVMLKDITDSRRINNNIQYKYKEVHDESLPIYVTCLSRLFWPQLKQDTFKLPPKIQEYIKIYTEAFSTIKAVRTLDFKPHYGKVDLTLTLEDRILEVTVTPLAATIISLFGDQGTWTMDDLTATIEATPSTLRPHLSFWVSKGVLDEDPTGTYTVIECSSGVQRSKHKLAYLAGAEEEESPSSTQKNDDMQMYMQFITGMLTNLGSLPVERIHAMLSMFAGGSLPPIQQLK
eukprot:Ihof_evm4s288 gene=Ihof_evmTU4s288